MSKSKSSLFLIELIIVILFFSLTSTVCIQLFVKAHLIGKHTSELNHSVEIAQNLAESFYGMNGDYDDFIEVLGLTAVGNSCLICYDEEFLQRNISVNEASYYAQLEYHEVDQIHTILIQIVNADTLEVLYSLDVDKYIRSGGDRYAE